MKLSELDLFFIPILLLFFIATILFLLLGIFMHQIAYLFALIFAIGFLLLLSQRLYYSK